MSIRPAHDDLTQPLLHPWRLFAIRSAWLALLWLLRTSHERHSVLVCDEHAVQVRNALDQLLKIRLHGILRGNSQAQGAGQ